MPNSYSITNDARDHLPEECISALFDLLQIDRLDWITTPSMREVAQSEHCPVCRSITHVVKQYQGKPQLETRTSDNLELSCKLVHYGHPPANNSLQGPRVLNIVFDLASPNTFSVWPLPSLTGWLPASGHNLGAFAIACRAEATEYSTADRSERFFKRYHETPDGTINSHFLAEWISTFEFSHSATCRNIIPFEIPDGILGFRLIDVEQMCVINAPRAAVYVTLSYVWGDLGDINGKNWIRASKGNINILTSPRGLDHVYQQIPQTVRDAITLTSRLHIPYLWVDSLCILHDDESSGLDQIAQIGYIFANSKFGISVPHGENADAGIPGIHPFQFPLRATLSREYIHPFGRILCAPPQLRFILERSKWLTRGWTYQESILPRLQLVCSPSQIYLLCQCGTSSSESHMLTSRHFEICFPDRPQFTFRDTLTGSNGTIFLTNSLWGDYAPVISRYSLKTLSYPSDCLNAISGYLTCLSRRWNTEFIFGLPETILPFALRWHGDREESALRRRKCTIPIQRSDRIWNCPVPSWSWVGWSGAVDHSYYLGSFESIWDKSYSVANPLWKLSDHGVNLTEADPRRWTLLQGKPEVAKFSIGRYESDDFTQVDHTTTEMYPIYSTAEKEPVGYADIPPSDTWPPPDAQTASCWLVAIMSTLSTTDIHKIPRPWERPEGMAHAEVVDVLVVEFDEYGIAYRIGIGSLFWKSWRAAGPTRKIITLG